MLSPVICRNKGFSLIEIMVAIAIMGFVFYIGVFANVDLYGRELLDTEVSRTVSVLQKARNRSMNNIYGSAHGVHIENDSYVIFREHPYLLGRSTNEVIPRNEKIVFGGINEVVFEQLSGNPNTGNITLSDDTQTKTISILKSGLIEW